MVVIGGLLTSTLLTLLLVPVIYQYIGGWQERRASRQAALAPVSRRELAAVTVPAGRTPARVSSDD